MKKIFLFVSMIILTGIIYQGCQENNTVESFEGGRLLLPTPVFLEGNPNMENYCSDIYTENINITDDQSNPYYPWDAPFPEGITVELSADGKYITWTATGVCVQAVIVKGGPDANIYYYNDNSTLFTDAGLVSPTMTNGNIPEVSHISFCYRICNGQQCWEEETAWAAGNRYVTKGNWAMYVNYAGAAKTVDLMAGQNMDAGDVDFSAPSGGNVTITITLHEGWRFKIYDPEDDNVMIQDYSSTPPAVNPAPGQFAYKDYAETSPFTITVPQSSFYGIHVVVEKSVECPE